MSADRNPIHGLEKTKWYERTLVKELFVAVPAVVAAGFAAFDAYPNGRWGLLLFSFLWLIGAQTVVLLSALNKDRREDLRRSHDGLRAAAYTLHESVLRALLRESGEDPGLRTTIHRVIPPINDPDHIEQIIDYVGGAGGGKNRKFPVRAGITGCAVRELLPFTMDRQDLSDDDYRKNLVSEWHYTKADAARATPDRYSAIAVPLVDKTGQRAIAVVYLDTHRKGAFSNKDTAQLVIDASGGISDYVGERYV